MSPVSRLRIFLLLFDFGVNAVNAIFSADKNWGLGKNGDLLVRIPEDLKDRFVPLTKNKCVVMGRKTLISLPGSKPLKNRTNLVLTRDKGFTCEGAHIVHGIEELADYLRENNVDTSNVCIIGGGEIYALFMPYCHKVYVTRINGEFDADTFVEDITSEGWSLMEHTPWLTSIAGVEYRYEDYTNPNAKNILSEF
ncbi:MAG: dihydrofolate reductase [Clostridiales bacterium]|nr:dihydrofolate reductase [Clostridiales bacterium]